MKKYLPIMILICLLFSIHCSDPSVDIEEIVTKPKDEPVNVEFVKEKRILIKGMSYIRLVIDNENGDVCAYGYEAEQKDGHLILKKYDNELNFIFEKNFPYGVGPGDVGNGTTFSASGDKMYGPDNTTRRVNVFDKDFNFIKFVKVLSAYFSTTITKNGSLFFAIDMTDVPKGYRYDFIMCTFPSLKKKVVHRVGTFWFWNDQKKVIIGGYPNTSFFIKNEKVYFLNMADYRLIMFDLDGKALKNVRLKVAKKKTPKEKKEDWLFQQAGRYGVEKCDLAEDIQPASWTIPLGKGFVVVKRNSYATECKGMVEGDYFDFELNHIGKINIPCFSSIYEIESRMPDTYRYHAGNLYLISEDEENEDFYLEKWKVVEN